MTIKANKKTYTSREYMKLLAEKEGEDETLSIQFRHHLEHLVDIEKLHPRV